MQTAHTHCCKVSRVVTDRGLKSPRRYTGDLNDYLIAKWLGTGQHEAIGYRPLVDWFNKRLMQAVYRRHDRSDIETRISAEYEALRDDSEAHRREEVLADLEADGIDGEALMADFISRSTLSRHLKNCLDVEKDYQTGNSDSEWEVDQIDFARKQFENNIQSALKSLDNKGQLPSLTKATVEMPVMLNCPECPTRVRLKQALEQGYICQTHLDQIDSDSIDSANEPVCLDQITTD